MIAGERPEFDDRATGARKPQVTAADAELALREFVARVGGVENARRALDLLALLSKDNLVTAPRCAR